MRYVGHHRCKKMSLTITFELKHLMLKFEIYYNLVYVFCIYDIVMYADLFTIINTCSRHLVL